MGRPDVSQPVDGPEFAQFLRFMTRARERLVQGELPGAPVGRPARRQYADVVPFARHVVETFPDRVLWGTDWPHPNMKSHMPDDGHLVDVIPRIAADRRTCSAGCWSTTRPAPVLGGLMTTTPQSSTTSPAPRCSPRERAKQGYHLNQFCMSLMKAENRERFKADERAYLDEWPMTEAQKQAVLDRDYNAMLDLGGNIYFLAKIFATDGLSYVQAVSTMTEHVRRGVPGDDAGRRALARKAGAR